MKIPLLLLTLALAGCVTTETTAPDGAVTRTKSADPAAVQLGSQALGAYVAIKSAKVDPAK